jgi:hypothetical protein
MKFEKLVFLFETPWIFGYDWGKMVVPPFTALFTGSLGERIFFFEFV